MITTQHRAYSPRPGRGPTGPVIGTDNAGQTVALDLTGPIPHVVAVGPTGTGKTTLLRSLFAQGLGAGGQGLILDTQAISHTWAHNLPNCSYRTTTEDSHDQILRLHRELERRSTLAHETGLLGAGPATFVLIEELSDLRRRLDDYAPHHAPGRGPAVRALDDLYWRGGQLGIHLLVSTQPTLPKLLGFIPARDHHDQHPRRATPRTDSVLWLVSPRTDRYHWDQMFAPVPAPEFHASLCRPGLWRVVDVAASAVTTAQAVYLGADLAAQLARSAGTAADELRADLSQSRSA